MPESEDGPLISLTVNASRPLIEVMVTVPVRGNWTEELGVADWVSVRLAVPEMGVVWEPVVRVPERVPV
jgi:hypothetical protein